jgi:hypothetical protein
LSWPGPKRLVALALELKPIGQHEHLKPAAFVLADNCGAGRGQAPVGRNGHVRHDRRRVRDLVGLRRHNPQLRAAGQLLGPPPRPFAQIAFDQGLELPGYLADQVRAVPRPRRFAEQLGVALAELPRGHLLKRSNLSLDVEFHVRPLWFSVR